MKRPALCALACASSLGFGVSAAQAIVILDVGAGDIQPNENLLFNNKRTSDRPECPASDPE